MAHKVWCQNAKALRRYSLGVRMASSLKFVAALYKNGFVYQHKIHKLLPLWSEDDLIRFW